MRQKRHTRATMFHHVNKRWVTDTVFGLTYEAPMAAATASGASSAGGV